MIKVLIAIPCYNESKSIQATITTLLDETNRTDAEFKIIVFDDGSTDDSVEHALKTGIVVHKHLRNAGLGLNFKTMVEHALSGNYDFLLTCDGDGQFPSESVNKVLTKALELKFDVVLGSRFLNRSDEYKIPIARRMGNRIVRRIITMISGTFTSDATCGLRVYSREALKCLRPTEKFSYTLESLTQLSLSNLKIVEVPITVLYFENRESEISGSLYRYGKKTIGICSRLILNAALRRFLNPLKLLFIPGLLFIGLFFYDYIQTKKFSGHLYEAYLGSGLGAIGLWAFSLDLIIARIDFSRDYQSSFIVEQVYQKKCTRCYLGSIE